MSIHARRLLAAIAVLSAIALVSTACSKSKPAASSKSKPAAAGNSVNVMVKDFAIGLNSASVKEGEVTFTIKNQGPSTHEFVVLRTSSPPDQLKIDSSTGILPEDTPGLEKIDEAEDIVSSTTATLTVNLTAGTYVLICNLPGHFVQGMHSTLEVHA